jgi:hypothetical protein
MEMYKLTKDDRLVYISTWAEHKEEKRRKIREEAEIRMQQLRNVNKEIKIICETMKEKGC